MSSVSSIAMSSIMLIQCAAGRSASSLVVAIPSWSDVTIVSPAKTAKQIEMPFGIWIRLGPKNRVLDEGPDPKRPHLFHFIFFIFLLLITFVISVSIMIVDLSTTNISHILSTVLLLDQASIDNRKKICQNSNTSPTRPYNMVNWWTSAY